MANKKDKIAVIIGAGPAGLTAAYELAIRTDIKPVIFEKTSDIGGLSKTVNYKGNRIDIGGHRFFSKSDRVMDWWLKIMPIQATPINKLDLTYHNQIESIELSNDGPDPEKIDRVMLIRKRLSRIYYLGKFFHYPITLNWDTINNLGLLRVLKIGASYGKMRLFPQKEENSLEDFFIHRFGKELYNTFFRDYTEKVWGVACSQIKSEWGAQRIKGLSISKAFSHAQRRVMSKDSSLSQKDTETSLIEKFLYPKYGPGQLWEEVAKIVQERGGQIHLNCEVIGLDGSGSSIHKVIAQNKKTNRMISIKSQFVFSTMPVKELIHSMSGPVPKNVQEVAAGLLYRDFITVGVLLKKLKIKNETNIKTLNDIIPDNWIYIQERKVKLARMQIFNNWSPYMARDNNTVWIGLEYLCNEGDTLWSKTDDEFARYAINELAQIGIIDKQDVLDYMVIKMPKTYPAYFGSYDRFDEIRKFTDGIENLFLIGRNGMHKYNNQDHSMLTAMRAVDNILTSDVAKDNLWAVNTENEYQELKDITI